MRLAELHPNELLALVGVCRAIASADGSISAKEGEIFGAMSRELGEDTMRALFARAMTAFPDEAALKHHLLSILRLDARQLIFDQALELAVSDALAPAEIALVRWLETAWSLSPQA